MFDDSADLHMALSQDLAPVSTVAPLASMTSMSTQQSVPAQPFSMPTEALSFPDTSNTEDNAFIASNLQAAVKTSEHQMILAAIQTTESRMEAAAKLGISPRTLRYKLAKLKAENGTHGLGRLRELT
jgi:DNA-binding NtrC family response regulator